MKTQKIILIGYRGCGKSSVGKKISSILNLNFIDLDEKIEEYAGKTIPDIISEKGWSYFRFLEEKLFVDFIKQENIVLSTGGGIIENKLCLKLLQNEDNYVVWLTASVLTIKKRLLEDKNNIRPALEGKNFILEIENVLKKRIPLYKKAAKITVETDILTIEEISEKIINSVCL